MRVLEDGTVFHGDWSGKIKDPAPHYCGKLSTAHLGASFIGERNKWSFLASATGSQRQRLMYEAV